MDKIWRLQNAPSIGIILERLTHGNPDKATIEHHQESKEDKIKQLLASTNDGYKPSNRDLVHGIIQRSTQREKHAEQWDKGIYIQVIPNLDRKSPP